ncbi:siderophore-interacting protein [Propionibacteriaceae bacterium Y2011]|uniref:siderophore-interacting protein n=1 Tax=Microlunatus sp. Y2014 TaxID=3418488 RepID=UPI003B46B335
MTEPRPYLPFRARLARRARITPHLLRLTFAGEELRNCDSPGLDQRIKIVIGNLAALDGATADDWYTRCREADPAPVIRTYTVREARPDDAELDVDVVDHGPVGPLSRFALSADLGTEVVLVAPNRAVPGYEEVGVAWQPGADRVLLVADETALPAVINILGSLPATVTGAAHVEVPTAADAITDAPHPAGVTVHWHPRDDAPPGSALLPELSRALTGTDGPGRCNGFADRGSDDGADESDEAVLWEEAADPGQVRAWVAGEAGMVKQCRPLLAAAGIDRSQASYMGYWKVGRAAVG